MVTSTKLAQQYAAALSRALRLSGVAEEALVEKLLIHLRTKGRMKLLPGIVRALKTDSARAALEKPLLEVAREEDANAAAARAAAAAAAGAFADAPASAAPHRGAALALGDASAHATTNIPEAVINKSLIRGWRVRLGGTLIDHSAKQTLVQIYQTIIR